MTNDVESFLSEPPRNGRGQYLMADDDGTVRPRTRATTFAETASDKTGLVKWKLRTIVAGMVARPDLFALAASTHPGDRDALNRIADDAFQAGAGDAQANMGTAMHEAARLVACGQLAIDAVAEVIRADVIAYFRELARHGITEHTEWMERSVLCRTYNTGGTLDRIYSWLPCPHCGRSLYIGDVKTGRDLSYGEHEFAVQLSEYANADRMFAPGSAEQSEPMPEVCRCTAIILHVPHGQGQAYAETIDIAMGWWAARLCAEVRSWRGYKSLRAPLLAGPQHQAAPPMDAMQGFPNADALAAAVAEQHAEPQTAPDPFAGMPQPDPEEVYNYESGPGPDVVAGEPQPPAGQPVQQTKAAAKDDAETVSQAELLLSAVPKSKGKTIMQQIARDLDPSIKQAQWAINIAKDIVRHPAWSDRSAELIERYVPEKYRSVAQDASPAQQTVNKAAEVPPIPAHQTEAEHDLPAQPSLAERQNTHADAQAERIQRAVDAVAVQTAPNPFAEPPAEPVRGEQYYLTKIELAETKRDLAALWQDASDHGVEWTAKLNAAGLARMQTINA